MRRHGLKSCGCVVAPILYGLSLLIPVAASAAQCIEQVEILNIPEEIERYGGVDDFESNVLKWKRKSVAALENMDDAAEDGL